MGIIELILLGIGFYAGGVVSTIVVIANNKSLARKFID
jgi:hypothetical protein